MAWQRISSAKKGKCIDTFTNALANALANFYSDAKTKGDWETMSRAPEALWSDNIVIAWSWSSESFLG